VILLSSSKLLTAKSFERVITILIIKANEMHCFSYLFDKVLYMFRTGPLSFIRSICHIKHDKYLLRVYSVEILLMMDSGPVRSM